MPADAAMPAGGVCQLSVASPDYERIVVMDAASSGLVTKLWLLVLIHLLHWSIALLAFCGSSSTIF